MTDVRWTAVDEFLTEMLVEPDPAMEAALAASAAADFPAIQVSALQGKMLMLFTQMQGASRVLEIGTLGGYSTLWFARGLAPGGRILTLELDQRRADIARANFVRARVASSVEVRVGPALLTLAALSPEDRQPYDLIFLDADKTSTNEYFDHALALSRPGTLIIVDNIVRAGALADPESSDASVRAMRRFMQRLFTEKRVVATALQTVGAKGYDGFTLARVVVP